MKDLFVNMAKEGEGMPDLRGMMDMLGEQEATNLPPWRRC